MDSLPAIQVISLVILLIFSGFFSSAETALTTVNRIQVQLLAENGSKRAKRVLWVLDHSSRMLSAILIGNNLVNISASALATTLTIKLFGNKYIGVATGILTLCVLIFGEIMPKSLATVHSLKLSTAYVNVVWGLMVVLTPIIWVIEGIRTVLMKLLHIDPDAKSSMTEDELKSLVDVGLEEGAIEDDEFQMISNVFSLDESLAKDIMVPRIDMTFVRLDATYEELMEVYSEYAYTRFPVYSTNRDTVIGTINIKDLLLFPQDEEFSIRKILREPHFTFEHKEVGTLLIEMRESSISMVIVLDEYGATSGMITMEDILEEIVGEIRDEYDKDERDDIVKLGENEYMINGSTNLDDLNEELDTDIESEEYDSIGGYIIEYLDRLPKSGEKIELENGITIIAAVVRRNRVEKVRMLLPDNVDFSEE